MLIHVLIILSLGVNILCQAQVSEVDKIYSVSGTVVEANSSKPIDKATVVAIPLKGGSNAIRGALSGLDGRFTIANLPSDRYRIYAQKQGYVRRSSNGDSNQLFEIGETFKGSISLALISHSAISGKVTDVNGKPLQGASVQVMETRLMGGRLTRAPVGRAITDDLGNYRVYDIPPGRYKVAAFLRDDTGVLGLRERKIDDRMQTEDYLVTYYPGTYSLETAAAVKVRSGETASDIDIRLGMGHSSSIQGVVENFPQGIGPIQVTLQPADFNGLGPRQLFTLNGGATEFIFKSIPTGKHVIRADVQVGNQTLTARREINVHDGTAQQINLNLQPPSPFVGAVVLEGKKELPSKLSLAFAGRDQPSRFSFPISPDGAFKTYPVPSDSYLLTVKDESASVYVKAIYFDNLKLDSNEVVVEQSPRSLRVVLGDDGGRIKGTVVNSSGKTIDRGLAVAVSSSGKDHIFAFPVMGGDFVARSLPPGRYRIVCISDVDSEQHIDEDILKKIREQGLDLDVPPTANLSLKFTARSSDEL